MWANTCGAPCSEGERIPWAPLGVSVGGCQKAPILGSGLCQVIWERVSSKLHAL